MMRGRGPAGALAVALACLGLAAAAPINAPKGSTHFSQDYPGAALELGPSERLGPAQLSQIKLPTASNERAEEEHDVVQMYENRDWGFPNSESPEMQMPGTWNRDKKLERMREERRANERTLRESKGADPKASGAHLVHAEQKTMANNKNAVAPAKPVPKALQNNGDPKITTSFDPSTGKVIHENKAEVALHKAEQPMSKSEEVYKAGIKKRDAYEKGTFEMGPIQKMEMEAEKARVAQEQRVNYANAASHAKINVKAIPAMTMTDVEKAFKNLAPPKPKDDKKAEKEKKQQAAMAGHDKEHPGKDAKSKADAKQAIKDAAKASKKSTASQDKSVPKQPDTHDSDPLVPAKWVDPEGNKEYFAADRPGEKLYDMDKQEGHGITVVHQHIGGKTHHKLAYTDHGALKNDDPRAKWGQQIAKTETAKELSTKPKAYDIPKTVKTGTDMDEKGAVSKSTPIAGVHVQLKQRFQDLTPQEAEAAINKVEAKAEVEGMGANDIGHKDTRAPVSSLSAPKADQLTVGPKQR